MDKAASDHAKALNLSSFSVEIIEKLILKLKELQVFVEHKAFQRGKFRACVLQLKLGSRAAQLRSGALRVKLNVPQPAGGAPGEDAHGFNRSSSSGATVRAGSAPAHAPVPKRRKTTASFQAPGVPQGIGAADDEDLVRVGGGSDDDLPLATAHARRQSAAPHSLSGSVGSSQGPHGPPPFSAPATGLPAAPPTWNQPPRLLQAAAGLQQNAAQCWPPEPQPNWGGVPTMMQPHFVSTAPGMQFAGPPAFAQNTFPAGLHPGGLSSHGSSMSAAPTFSIGQAPAAAVPPSAIEASVASEAVGVPRAPLPAAAFAPAAAASGATASTGSTAVTAAAVASLGAATAAPPAASLPSARQPSRAAMRNQLRRAAAPQ
mmetsp:Transcript_120142/g.212371  ORF Transcript_120142/g.212371 Transcript_120142/m.212371 type:complete len:373 (+) Transcript_120142:2-1120(+)